MRLSAARKDHGQGSKVTATAAIICAGLFAGAGHSQEQQAEAAPAAEVGTLQGKVTVAGDREGPVIVYVKDAPGKVTPPGERKRVAQKHTQFMPKVLVVVKGETIDFPNDDPFYHNVFSVTEGNQFDLGLYRGGVSKSAKMKSGGEVQVYCNIHEDMSATVLVLENPHFVAVGDDGRFKLDGVPAGRRTIVAWSAQHEPKEIVVDIQPAAPATAEFALSPRPRKRHMNKHGEDYGRYR